MLRRDWGDRRPWPTWKARSDRSIGSVAIQVKKIIRAAGLRDELSVHQLPPRRFHRGCRRRFVRRRNQGAGPPPHREGFAALRQAHDEADGVRHQEAAGDSEERSVKICRNDRNPTCRNDEMKMAQTIEKIGMVERTQTGDGPLEGVGRQRMSALGQKRTCAVQKAMSALPQKRTSSSALRCPLCANSGHSGIL